VSSGAQSWRANQTDIRAKGRLSLSVTVWSITKATIIDFSAAHLLRQSGDLFPGQSLQELQRLGASVGHQYQQGR